MKAFEVYYYPDLYVSISRTVICEREEDVLERLKEKDEDFKVYYNSRIEEIPLSTAMIKDLSVKELLDLIRSELGKS